MGIPNGKAKNEGQICSINKKREERVIQENSEG